MSHYVPPTLEAFGALACTAHRYGIVIPLARDPRGPASRRPPWPLVLVSVASLAAAAVFIVAAALPETRSPLTYRFVIPPGTAAKLAAGANISLFPERLVIDKGDVIDLVNNDDYNDEVGPFYVAAHGELRQAVDRPGTYTGTCTLHRSGRVVIVVR